MTRRAIPAVSASFWQRRHVLRHYRHASDEALAAATDLSPAQIRALLDKSGARRTVADGRRIARLSSPIPHVSTPRVLWRALTEARSRSLGGVDTWLCSTLGVLSLLLYGLTAARTVTGEDAGELLGAAFGLGVPHPPGYPLWTLLGWLFAHGVPFGAVAWRVAMVSAVFAALANALLLALCLKTMRHRLAALGGAGLFGVSLTHWTQAVIPEVYGLHMAFVAGIALLLVRLAERPTTGSLLALAAVCGASLTNHHTALPVVAGAALGALLVAPRLFLRPLTIAGALAAALLPLLLYLYLPWASARDPYVDWGNPETLAGLQAHVMREQYAGVDDGTPDSASFGERYGDYVARLGVLGGALGRQFGSAWPLAFVVLGAFVLAVRQRGLWLFLTGVGWFSSVGLVQVTEFSFDREHVYANQIFFIPAWMVCAWYLAGGLDEVLGWLGQWIGEEGDEPDDAPRRALAPHGRRRVVHATAALAVTALVARPALAHYALADRSDTRLVADYGRAILDVMEEGALYLPASDHSTFAAMYWQGVEGHRPDVVLADKYGRIEPELEAQLLTDEDRAALSRLRGEAQRDELERRILLRWPGPVYCASRQTLHAEDGVQLEPVGPVFKVMSPDEAKAWWTEDADGRIPGLALWDEQLAHLDLDEPDEGVDFTVQIVRGDLRYLRGTALLRAGRLDEALAVWQAIEGELAPLKPLFNNIGAVLAEHGRPQVALDFFTRALDEDDGYGLAWRNLALVYRELGSLASAEDALDEALALDDHDHVSRLLRARIRVERERPRDALLDYEILTHQRPDDVVPWREAAQLLEEGGDWDGALALYTEVLVRDPRDEESAARRDRIRSGMAQLFAEGEAPNPSSPAGLDPLGVLATPMPGDPTRPRSPAVAIPPEALAPGGSR